MLTHPYFNATVLRGPTVVSYLLPLWGFLYIYSPNLRYFPHSGLIAALALFSFVLLRLPREFKAVLCFRPLRWFSVLWFLVIVYATAVELSAQVDGASQWYLSYPFIFMRFYIEVFVTSACLTVLLRRYGNEVFDGTVRLFAFAVSLQFAFVISMMLNSSLRDLYFAGISLPVDKLDVGSVWYEVRGYGVASGYFYSYPLFNGLVFFLFALLAVKRSRWYLVLAVIALLPVMLNARIGLIFLPLAACALFFLFVRALASRSAPKYLWAIIGFVTLISVLWSSLSWVDVVPAAVFSWVSSGLDQYLMILLTGESETLNILFREHLHAPSGIAFLLGEGLYAFRGTALAMAASDIGYVNYLYFGGVGLSALLYFSFLSIPFGVLSRRWDILTGLITIGIVIAVSVANFKGIVFSANPFTKGVFMILLALLVRRSAKYTPRRLRQASK